MSDHECAWLAGILEGEGTFLRRSKILQARIRVQMTDEDVVRSLQAVTGVGSIIHIVPKNSNHKESWAWTVAKIDHVRWLIARIAPLLGVRRREATLLVWNHCGMSEADFPAAQEPSGLSGYHWLAGYLEGEGTFYWRAKGAPAVDASSTDLDVLLRAQRIAGLGRIYALKSRNPNHTAASVWSVYRVAEARSLAECVKPMMHSRRQAKIEEILKR